MRGWADDLNEMAIYCTHTKCATVQIKNKTLIIEELGTFIRNYVQSTGNVFNDAFSEMQWNEWELSPWPGFFSLNSLGLIKLFFYSHGTSFPLSILHQVLITTISMHIARRLDNRLSLLHLSKTLACLISTCSDAFFCVCVRKWINESRWANCTLAGSDLYLFTLNKCRRCNSRWGNITKEEVEV